MSATTSVSFVNIGGNPAYHVQGLIPVRIQEVAGATFLKKQSCWVLPAFRPFHRVALEDLDRVVRQEKRSLALDPGVQAHLKALEAFEEIPEDFPFITQPFAHQREGLRWLLNHPRAGLLFDPGLGKCKITVDAYRLFQLPMLILCPAVVLRTWQREFWTHGHIDDVVVVEGSREQKTAKIRAAIARPPAALVITYESAALLLQDLLLVPFKILVMDESHRIKDVSSVRTKAALMLSEGRPRRILLSGTPTLGSPFSVYAQLKALGHYFAPEAWGIFKSRYATFSAQNEHQVLGYRNLAELNQRVARVCLRRKQEECLDLPELTIVDVEFRLSDEQVSVYNQLIHEHGDALGCAEGFAAEQGLLFHRDGPQRPVEFLWAPDTVAKLNKLEQVVGGFVNLTRANLGVCNGCPRLDACVEERIRPYTPACAVVRAPEIVTHRFTDNARRDACAELLETILENPENKVIVWTRYIAELETVAEIATEQGHEHVVVRGGMDIDDFEAAMHRFNTDPRCRVYIGQVASGIGVTLNAANYTVYYSLPWSHEHYVQSRARNYRIGQKRRVTVYRLLAEGSTDAQKAAALDLKIDVEDLLTRSDYSPSCAVHSKGFHGRSSPAACTCDGAVDRIVAQLKPIQ